MKKQYVKPVMESEVFIANEYVAACWQGTCTATHKLYLIGDVTSIVHRNGLGVHTVKNVDEKPSRIELTTESEVFGDWVYYDHVYENFQQVPNASQ